MWKNAQFNNRLQVTQLGLGTSVTDMSLWRLNYEFGEIDAAGNLNTAKNNGNVARITTTSPVGVYTQSYRYDSLDRLKDAWENSGATQNWTQNFQYDRYGNRIGFQQTKTGQPNYNYTPTVDVNTNRFTAGQGYEYDFAGNVTKDNYGRQFFFNGDNKQTEVRNQQNQTVGQYFYDADGKRIKKITPTETTIFVYSGGKLVMEMTSASTPQTTPVTQYIVNDMLGSIRVLTNQAGQVISRRDFMPFGEDIQRANYGTDNMRQKFTGYQKDNETGLDFAEARMYGNWHGRFTAVDPLLASGKSGDPQTFNRYIYSLNNPTNLVDPSGMQSGKKVWAYRDGDGGTYFDPFDSVEAMNKANENMKWTPFCSQKPGSCSKWSQWTRGDFVLSTDRMAQRLNEDGTKSSWFTTEGFGTDEQWNQVVSEWYAGKDFSQLSMNILNAAHSDYFREKNGLVILISKVTGESTNTVNQSLQDPMGQALAIQAGAFRFRSPSMAGSTAPKGNAYSVAFEMKLSPVDLGKSRSVHFNRANAALDNALSSNPGFASQMERLIPGVSQSASRTGGRFTPNGWVWHHDQGVGVMQLVPKAQHVPGSIFWQTLHPGGRGGYSSWAIPRGAPKN